MGDVKNLAAVHTLLQLLQIRQSTGLRSGLLAGQRVGAYEVWCFTGQLLHGFQGLYGQKCCPVSKSHS